MVETGETKKEPNRALRTKINNKLLKFISANSSKFNKEKHIDDVEDLSTETIQIKIHRKIEI